MRTNGRGQVREGIKPELKLQPEMKATKCEKRCAALVLASTLVRAAKLYKQNEKLSARSPRENYIYPGFLRGHFRRPRNRWRASSSKDCITKSSNILAEILSVWTELRILLLLSYRCHELGEGTEKEMGRVRFRPVKFERNLSQIKYWLLIVLIDVTKICGSPGLVWYPLVEIPRKKIFCGIGLALDDGHVLANKRFEVFCRAQNNTVQAGQNNAEL